ncbi:alpha-amylase, partial [candidate division KSB1 bacterium]|nr:alpha-amylase [candidate division KSB1 bacterium]
ANFFATRVVVQKMNQKRDLLRQPELAIKAGHLNAMGLIDEILHYVVQIYREQINADVMKNALQWIESELGEEYVNKVLHKFTTDFPPVEVYQNKISVEGYLQGKTKGDSNRQIALEELLALWLENMNSAFSPFSEMFDDSEIEKKTGYRKVIEKLHAFFETQEFFGPENENLIDLLRSPAIAVPNSLFGQLEYIRTKWSSFLGRYLYRLLSGLDLIREEEKMRGLGPPLMEVPYYEGAEVELERYSQDRDWMPRLVMIAKSTYVWLDQLSKRYKRPINRLDQIPDEELDRLAKWGFSGLWLIGLWERSKASRRIKQLCGNPEAVASAYSLFDYQIAEDLGGEEAFQNLKQRAWQRGIRMAGDMVPNHVGIDGKWVIEHPDWFVSLDYSPYPSYTFNGPNLSWDDSVGLYIEDHYYSRNDAAVVFKRVDHRHGVVKYIYHGNDGTSMPWNDTAQLNYLNPEVREAVIQTILHVARNFPIIRFDAAMTLTKKHFQRLWFPQPGTGGDIPSRAEFGMDKHNFDQTMPEEFWREVVDRVAEEIPDTLLLAEAFWLMEGYFVRTLGMHRVYNSAFMNMLKNEHNDKYRASIRNVLEFDPEILKRFVNFMNNPDEDTAVAQFGKDDKYFGVAMLMVTMPGLPMFGHGQIEGFTEKYGMEYKRAYWDEQVDEHLIWRHEREIFPLMHKRYLFSDVKNFLLYDFFNEHGGVNEDVFAYSNSVGTERALVVYHNKYDSAHGWIRNSASYSVKTGNGDEKKLVQKNLGQGLGLTYSDDYFCIFRDHLSGLEYIRSSKELHEKGLFVSLGAYKYQVFLDFREVQDNVWRHYANLAGFLNGRGVPDIEQALKETFLQPILLPFKEIVSAGRIRDFIDSQIEKPQQKVKPEIVKFQKEKLAMLLQEVKTFTNNDFDVQELVSEQLEELGIILRRPVIFKKNLDKSKTKKIASFLTKNDVHDPEFQACVLYGWWSVHALGKTSVDQYYEQQSRSWIDEWLFGKILAGAFQDFGLNEDDALHSVNLIKLLTTHQHWYRAKGKDAVEKADALLEQLLQDSEVQLFIQVNRYNDVLWFNRESFEALIWWLMQIAVLKHGEGILNDNTKTIDNLVDCYKIVQQIKKIEDASGYQVDKLIKPVQK